MSKFLALAELLEKAAQALREADAQLGKIPSPADDRELRLLPGYERLSVRARKCLDWQRPPHYPRLDTVARLCSCSAREMLERKNFGETTLQEIRGFLDEEGLHLRGE